MVDDVVRNKGLLTLGSRLRRIGERLQAESQTLMDERDEKLVASGQYPILAALEEQGPLSVGDLADAIGVRQPGVTRTVGQLAKRGIVVTRRGERDQRTTEIELTDLGRGIVARGREDVWPRIEACVSDLLNGDADALLNQLDRLEESLDAASFRQRSARRERQSEIEDGLLARPVWSALQTVHTGLSVGSARARRFYRDISPFAASIDDTPESLAELGALIRETGPALLGQEADILFPPGVRIVQTATVVQMRYDEANLLEANQRPLSGVELRLLGDTDRPAMLELATLTKPGPFEMRTNRLGEYWGIKQDGRLVAMAGERLKQPGFTELSGVCTHPDHTGQGYARALCQHVIARIRARNERVYLHAYVTNTQVQAFYERLGFRTRRRLNVAEVEPA